MTLEIVLRSLMESTDPMPKIASAPWHEFERMQMWAEVGNIGHIFW